MKLLSLFLGLMTANALVLMASGAGSLHPLSARDLNMIWFNNKVQ
jgi:hypothetical protein